jgi:hypothetical protein
MREAISTASVRSGGGDRGGHGGGRRMPSFMHVLAGIVGGDRPVAPARGDDLISG